MSQNKRKQERLQSNLFAELYSTDPSENIGRGVVVDVSLSGLAIDTETDLHVNSEIECHIEVPLRLRAKVVRSIKEGQVKRYGIRFVGQSFIDKFILRKILKGNRQTKKISL